MERLVNLIKVITFMFLFFLIMSIYFYKKNPPQNYTPTNTQEHKYVQERFKQEGFTKEESQRASDAIYRFQQSQK